MATTGGAGVMTTGGGGVTTTDGGVGAALGSVAALARHAGSELRPPRGDGGGLVLRRLPAHVDRVRFAAVCPQWRSAARQGPLPPPLPLLALPDGTVYSLPRSDPFHFPGCAGYVDASGNWFLFSGEDGYFMRDAFSNATIVLPAMSRVRLKYADDGARRPAWVYAFDEALDVRKVTFCSPHLIAAVVSFRHRIRIAVCMPGATSWWSVYMDHWFPWRFDIAFYQGKLYVIDYDQGDLSAIDISVDRNTDDPCVSQIRRVINRSISLRSKFKKYYAVARTTYLVESRGALLMVRRKMHGIVKSAYVIGEEHPVYADGRNQFEVFQANFERSRWTKLSTIGHDQVLFLQRRCSRSVLVSQQEIPGDCIAFVEDDDENNNWYDRGRSSSCKIYDMKDGKISAILPLVLWKHNTVAATWLFPG
ncbi:hypothetical protein EJB05_26821, partial [Eragrostis curvula]